ncbi:MAG: hypothetical protein EKK29_19195 [Hyphomicrobiales bacterium]|nr:MAG: hypothetical protein EKK29_19195 [Hyphomicrobiales bacterium]
MKKFLFLFALLPTLAYASDDAVDCAKKNDGSVKCEVKKDKVVVDAITVNGGGCPVAENAEVLHQPYNAGDKFTVPAKGGSIVPGFGCGYVRMVTIQTHDGKTKTFGPM